MGAPGERLQLRLDYRADLFDRASVEALGWRLVRLLEGAVAGPDVAIGRLELLSAAERRQLLEEWNATDRVLGGGTLVDALGAQAAAHPDAVAAVFEDARLSYAELEARANQLAHHLRGLGVGAETVVGLCLERRLELDTQAAALAGQPTHAPAITLEAQNLAYVIYTSGSTGTPKGVAVEHRHILASNAARSYVYPEPQQQRFLLLSSISFDSSL